jgi:WD40 repeat protein
MSNFERVGVTDGGDFACEPEGRHRFSLLHYVLRITYYAFLLTPLAAERPSPIWSLEFSPDGKTLAVGIHQQVLLLDTKSWKVRDSLPEFMDSVRCLRYSRDGKLLMVAGGYPKEIGEVVIFQTSDLEYIGGSEHHVDVVEDVAIHPSGKQYVTASMDHSAIITDHAEGEILKILKHKDRVYAVAVSPAGKFVITGSADSHLRVWDMKGELVTSVQQQDLVVRKIKFLGGSEFLASHADGQISKWSLNQRGDGKWALKQLRKEKSHGGLTVYSLDLLPDGKRALSAGADGRCVVWDANRLKPIHEIIKDGDQLYASAVSPDGAIAVAGGRAGRLHVYSLKDGKMVRTFVPPAPKMVEE